MNATEYELMHKYWQASNYIAVGQVSIIALGEKGQNCRSIRSLTKFHPFSSPV